MNLRSKRKTVHVEQAAEQDLEKDEVPQKKGKTLSTTTRENESKVDWEKENIPPVNSTTTTSPIGIKDDTATTTPTAVMDDPVSTTPAPVKDVKPKKKTKRNQTDPNYNKNTYNAFINNSTFKESGSYQAMLYDTDEFFMDKDEKKTQVKTSVMIDYEALFAYNQDKNIDWDELGKKLTESFTTVSSFRPILPIDFSDNLSPTKGTTPDGKTVLTRVKKIGFLSFYSNKPVTPLDEMTSQTTLDADSEFYQSPNFQAVQEIHALFKKQEAFITRALLKATKKQNDLEGGRSQNRVMVKEGRKEKEGRADEYAIATRLFTLEIPMKWQWLHLIPHFVWGKLSQSPDVLVGGSQYANADMDSVESQIKFLAKNFPEGFKLVVEADLIEGTHMGITMKYFIKTPAFCFPFDFNLQTTNQPHVSQPKYIRTLIHDMCEICKKKSTAKKQLGSIQFPWFGRDDKKTNNGPNADTRTTNTNVSNPSKK